LVTVVLGVGSAAAPCGAASTDAAPPATTAARVAPAPAPALSLARLSTESRRLLADTTARAQQPTTDPGPSGPSAFFHSKRGALTLALMGAGAGFALWSIQHDRKPVKSPVR